MGLGFTICFPVGQDQNTGRERYEEYFRNIPSIVPNWTTRCLFDEDGFRVKLVPFEEEVYGEWEDGRLCISAKTNSAGPGYHAYLIDILDGLRVSPISVEDETGYYEDRDFGHLQDQMAGWLKGVSEQLLEMSEESDYMDFSISLSTDWSPENTGHFASCPLGYFEKDFFEMARKHEYMAPKFFVWWHREQDARFFRNVLLNMIWCEINWLPPETDTEYEAIAAALACFDKAYASDPGLGYPIDELKELSGLAGTGGSFGIVYSDMIKKYRPRHGELAELRGYMRGAIRRNVVGWHLTHDGNMHSSIEEDGSLVLWDDRRTIRITILSVQLKEDVPNKSETLLRDVTEKEEGCEPLRLRNPEIAACIQRSVIEENGETLYMTRMTAALDNEIMVMSLFSIDEGDREWATKICASVS